MTDWGSFRRAALELVEVADARIGEADLILLGTLRADGWPRISPVEPLVVGDELYLGMMWQSKKALDLRRDPRCVVHSATVDAAGTDGDVKVYGRAEEVTDAEVRARYGAALQARTGWQPEGDFHLFAVDVVEVGYFAVTGRQPRRANVAGTMIDAGQATHRLGAVGRTLVAASGPCHNEWTMSIPAARRTIILVLVS